MARYLDLCAGTLDVGDGAVDAPGIRRSCRRCRLRRADAARGSRQGARAAVVAPVAADALDLPLPDERASGAIVAFGIRNVVDLDRALREIYRVLAPGATIRDPRVHDAALRRGARVISFVFPPHPSAHRGAHQRASHGVRLSPAFGRELSRSRKSLRRRMPRRRLRRRRSGER